MVRFLPSKRLFITSVIVTLFILWIYIYIPKSKYIGFPELREDIPIHKNTSIPIPIKKTIPTPPTSNHRYLSYQPPGNGWNNQRIAFEHAVVFSRLLNRTLLAPPMAPFKHIKRGYKRKPGAPILTYIAYNQLRGDQLIPMDSIIDFQHLSQLVQVEASTGSHMEFVEKNSALSWRRVCHSAGYGFWMDRSPRSEREKEILSKQKFKSYHNWVHRCTQEKGKKPPYIRFLLDELQGAEEDILYFEEATLFTIELRFFEKKNSIAAQAWISNYIRYHPDILKTATNVQNYLLSEYPNGYNAIHVRQKERWDVYVAEFWLKRLNQFRVPTNLTIYVATNQDNLTFFEPFIAAGYKLVFRGEVEQLFKLDYPEMVMGDVIGMSEQIVCEKANLFVPSIGSTFSEFISRERHELKQRDGLFTQGYHFVWAEHSID